MIRKILLATILAGAMSTSAFAFNNSSTTTSPRSGSSSSASRSAAAPVTSGMIDINHADQKTLASLRGIGSARATAIIQGRPYTGKDDLVTRKIIPGNVYSAISDQIVARQK